MSRLKETVEHDLLSLSCSFPGSVGRITEQHLKATAADSEAGQLLYIMKEDPGAGRLQMAKADNREQISVKGPIRSFTQADVSQGQPACSPSLSKLPKALSGITTWELSTWQPMARAQPVHFLFSIGTEL